MTGPTPGGWAGRPVAAARAGLLALVVLAPLAVGAGALAAGRAGALAGLAGLSVPAAVLALTWAAVELGRSRSPQGFAALLMASYVVKLGVVIALLVLLRRADLASPVVTGVVAIVGLVVALAVEGLVVLRTRAPYVEP